MPVQIGMGAHSFSDPTGLLSDCHRRIEMFLDSLEAVASVAGDPSTDETKRALTSALRYFRESAPKHNADEEESLFPRLRQIERPDAQSALERLEQLEEDHRSASLLHEEVEHLGQLYLSAGILSPAEAGSFSDAIAKLKAMYREHIRVEDELVFPVAARVLSRAELAQIGEEMAARRGFAGAKDARPGRS
jgi:iron-sulfur cluster repair protein YtfE (RIC family)